MTISRLTIIALASLVCLLIILSLAYSLFHYKRLSSSLKWLPPFFLLALICEGISLVKFVHFEFNAWLINLYTIGEFFFLANFIAYLTQEPGRGRKLFLALNAGIVVSFLFYFSWFRSIYQFSSYTETLENLFLMGMCIYFFVHSLNKPLNCHADENQLVKLVVASYFIYFSGIILIWLGYEFIYAEFRKFTNLVAYFNGFLNLGLKVALLVGWLAYDHRIRRARLMKLKS